MNFERNILITGGAGFIGSHLVRFFVGKYPKYRIVNLDKLTYAGNLVNLLGVEKEKNYIFEHADICDIKHVRSIFEKYEIDSVIHLAAESHVDRSIEKPFTFAETNILGTLSLLQVAHEFWKNFNTLAAGGGGGFFITFRQMRFMELLDLIMNFLRKKQNTIRILHILPAKQVAIILCVHFMIHMDFQRLLQIVQITMGRFSFQKS